MFCNFILLFCIGNEWPSQGLEPQPPRTPPPFGLWAKKWLAPDCAPCVFLDAVTKKFQQNWRTFVFVCLGFRLTLRSCNVLGSRGGLPRLELCCKAEFRTIG